MRDRDEQLIWEGTPSQVVNFKVYLLCGLTFFLVVPLGFALWKWLQVRCHRYRITTERIQITEGVFSQQTHELELYRIRDVTFAQPFFLRLFSLANLVLDTTDPSSPRVVLQALPQAKTLWDEIRHSADVCRRKQGLREIDLT
jgi:uncharacterized membrane protein YdbT with pleckstrin-like domain